MKKTFFLIPVLAVILATPYFMLAAGNPAVTGFGVTGSFVAGSKFSITLGNVPDLTKLNPTATLNGLPLNVTGASKNTVIGTLPEGVSTKGGALKVKYQNQTVEYTLYVPYIEKIFAPKIEKGGSIIVSGNNFDEQCKINLANSDLKMGTCTQRMAPATIGSKFDGGNITVVSHGLTSAPFPFSFQAPKIEYAENPAGILPGTTVTFHVKGLIPNANTELLFDGKPATIASQVLDKGLIRHTLPDENVKGAFQLTVNGIQSNTLTVDASLPPTLKDYKLSSSSNGKTVEISGKNLSSDPSKVKVTINGKGGNVLYSTASTLLAELPKEVSSGCLQAEVFGKKSNCLSFSWSAAPIMKGYLDPVEIDMDNQYEWKIFASGVSDNPKDVTVFVDGSKATLVGKSLNLLTLRLDKMPEKGEVYVVSQGIESNRISYDFGQRFYPFISSVFAPSGFRAGFPFAINGANFGRHRYKKDITLNVAGGELVKLETKEIDWKIEPTQITSRLDDKKKTQEFLLFSITRKGKKSNEIRVPTGELSKEGFCSPWIQKIQYPEGITPGSTIRLYGQCFNRDAKKILVHFDDKTTPAILSKGNLLEAKIPEGAKAKGKLKITEKEKTSNLVDFVAAPDEKADFALRFLDPPKSTLETEKEGTLAKIGIKNTLGQVTIQTLKLMMVYEDDKTNPESFTKTGAAPFDQIRINLTGSEKQTIKPVAINKEGPGLYSILVDDIRVSPTPDEQILEFKSTPKNFALNNAKFYFTLNLAKAEDFSALHFDKSTTEVMKNTQKPIQSPKITLLKSNPATCFDSDPKKANCSAFLNPGTPATITPAAPSKPKIPKLPTQ